MQDRPPRTTERGAHESSATALPIPLWARELVRLMDSAIRVPGTDFRVGLDALIGLLFPGGGDAIGALPALMLLGLALRNGVPPVIVLRMVLNIAIDALLGAVPLLGDLFDAAYRANEKNLKLLERHGGPGRRPGLADYAVVGGAMLVVVVLALLPIVLVGLVLSALFGS